MKKTKKLWYLLAAIATVAAFAACGAACAPAETPAPPPQYTVTFKINEGLSAYEKVTAAVGAELSRTKPDPVRAGFAFDGWSLTPDGEVTALPDRIPDGNVTYYAVFSKRFGVTLDVGAGTYAGETSFSVRAGDKLYDIVKDIAPTAPGKSAFDGWYFDGEKIDANSQATAPDDAVVLQARYTVGYTLVTKKETGYGKGTYGGNADSVIGTGFVGSAPDGARFPTYEGFDLVPASFILSATSDNDFTAYYNVRAVNVTFSANLPKGFGDVANETVTGGYGDEFEVPECTLMPTGYRFMYWATDPSGDGRVSDTIALENDVTLYAIWLKGCVDSFGASEDYIFLDRSGDTPEVYLDRMGVQILGEYDDTTHIFVFKNGDDVLVRGFIDEETGTFAYFVTAEYKLRVRTQADEMYGALDDTVTLSLSDDGTAVYNNKGTAVNGKYSADEDGGLLFTPTEGGKSFTFKLSRFRSTEGVEENAFEIRGEETGVYIKYANGDMNGNYLLLLDGFGSAILAVSPNSDNEAYYSGMYCAVDTENAEYAARFENGGNLLEFIFHVAKRTVGEQAIDIYVEQDFVNEIFVKQVGEFDKTAADAGLRFELDGYGIEATKIAADGARTNGSYSIDTVDRVFTFTPEDGETEKYFLDTVTENNGELQYYVFEAQQDKPELDGRFSVTGLETIFKPGKAYYYRFYNDGVVRLFVAVPTPDEFFQMYDMKFELVAEGTYKSTGEDGEYAIHAPIAEGDAYIIWYLYYMISNGEFSFDISNFGDFKFTLDTEEKTGKLVVFGDGQEGKTFTLDGTTYTLDGYGVASAADDKTLEYSCSASLGTLCVIVTSKNEAGKDVKNVFVEIEGELLRITEEYIKHSDSSPADTFIGIKFFENSNKAALVRFSGLSVDDGLRMIFYSYGTVAWNADGTAGTYTEIALFDPSAQLLSERYGNFGFLLRTFTTESEDEITQFVIVPNAEASGMTITTVEGGTLTFDLEKSKVKYEKGEKVVIASGNFAFTDNYLTISGFDASISTGKSYKFAKNEDGHYTEVGIEAGEWLDGKGKSDRLILSGIYNDDATENEDGTKNDDATKNGTLRKYDAETGNYTDYPGKYIPNPEEGATDYFFTYTDENGVKKEMRFAVFFDSDTSLPVFREYVEYVGSNGIGIYANFTDEKPTVALFGGGYNDLYLQTPNGYTTGVLNLIVDDQNKFLAYEFVSDEITLYFTILKDSDNTVRAVLLDGTFTADSMGEFVCDAPTQITVPNKGNVINITITKLVFSGLGLVTAVLEDGSERQMYYDIDTNGTDFFLCEELSKQIVIVADFRLYIVTDDEDPDIRSYVARFMDSRLFTMNAATKEYELNTYVSDKAEMFTTDGYTNALFVDDCGVVYSGEFVWVDGHDNVVKLVYADENRRVTVYITLSSDGSFTVSTEAPPAEVPDTPEGGGGTDDQGGEAGN